MILRLQYSWEIKQDREGHIQLFSSLKAKTYEIKSKTAGILPFLHSLKEGVKHDDLEEIAKKCSLEKSTADSIISKLKAYGVIIEQDTPISVQIDSTMYDRQIRFFRGFENQILTGETINDNLQDSTVLIVGLGGYGSWTALLCARMGIRNIIGVDFDSVEITNLHRQILYDRQDIGTPKVEACRKKIVEADPEINFIGHSLKVTSPESLYPLMNGVDLVLNPFSYLPVQKATNHPAGMVAQAAMQRRIPCLTFGGSWIGPLTIPGQTPCYFCTIKILEMNGNLDPDSRNQHIQKRAFAPPIAACCSLAVYEASRFLSKCDAPQVLRGIMQLDIVSFSKSRFLPLTCFQDCVYSTP